MKLVLFGRSSTHKVTIFFQRVTSRMKWAGCEAGTARERLGKGKSTFFAYNNTIEIGGSAWINSRCLHYNDLCLCINNLCRPSSWVQYKCCVSARQCECLRICRSGSETNIITRKHLSREMWQHAVQVSQMRCVSTQSPWWLRHFSQRVVSVSVPVAWAT